MRATLKNEQAIAILWPAKAEADHWITLVIDLLQIQRDFDTLFSKHRLTSADLGDSAVRRYVIFLDLIDGFISFFGHILFYFKEIRYGPRLIADRTGSCSPVAGGTELNLRTPPPAQNPMRKFGGHVRIPKGELLR